VLVLQFACRSIILCRLVDRRLLLACRSVALCPFADFGLLLGD
jgi:hypothetical protein